MKLIKRAVQLGEGFRDEPVVKPFDKYQTLTHTHTHIKTGRSSGLCHFINRAL